MSWAAEWAERHLYDVDVPTTCERAELERRLVEAHRRSIAADVAWRRREAAKMARMDEHERMMRTDADYYRYHRRLAGEREHDEMLNRVEES